MAMTKPLILKIKTVAGERAEEWVDAQRWEPDSTLSKVDSPPKAITDIKTPELRENRLAEWREQQALKLEQSVLRKRQLATEKAGLHWWTGKVVSVAWVDVSTLEHGGYASPEDEVACLRWLSVKLATKPDCYVAGRSSVEFDFPFLVGRYLAHNLPLPRQLRHWGQVKDVHDMFGYKHLGSQRSTLEDYAFGLGLSLSDYQPTTDLYNQALLGNDEAVGELSRSALSEAKVVAEMYRRYLTTEEGEPTDFEINGIPIPF